MKKVISFIVTLMMIMSVGIVKAQDYYMNVRVTDNQVVISLDEPSNGTVYAYQANEYAPGDAIHGLSDKIKIGEEVGKYTGGQATITFDRYDDAGRDRLYNKYYLLNGSGIVDGPKYATSIPSMHANISFTQDSIKGLFNEGLSDMSYAKDLGVSSITTNILLSDLLDPNGNGDDIEFTSNGKTYYFHRQVVESYDRQFIAASQAGFNVVAILLARPDSIFKYDQITAPTNTGTDTSKDDVRDYYIATLEFLASRYSQDAAHGLVQTYIISNEIDFTSNFFSSHDLNVFMEEYARSLRLANLAVKKYAPDIQVVVPFTRYWCGDVKKIGREAGDDSFRPREMIDWLAKYTNARGAYDWGIAPHVNGTLNTSSRVSATDISFGASNGDYNSSGEITFSNVEMLSDYLNQSDLKYNGQRRDVYLSESGVSSSNDTAQNYKEQCASLAQSYYKVAQLSFIKTFNYYRLKDDISEYNNHLRVGLLGIDGKKKPAYEVYKYIDGKNTLDVTDEYLKYIVYKRDGTDWVATSNDMIRGWKDTMTVYSSSFDWDKHWNFYNILKKSVRNEVNVPASTDAAHVSDDGKVLEEATTDHGGLKEYRCKKCNALIKEEKIPRIVEEKPAEKSEKTSDLNVTGTNMKKTVYVFQVIKIRLKGAKSFKSSNKKIATVNQKGVVRFKKPGKVTITFKKGNLKYRIRFTVKDPIFVVNKKSVTLKVKKSYKVKVKKLKPYGKVKWKVKNKKIAKVRKGKITGLKKGKTTVTAQANGKKIKIKVRVVKSLRKKKKSKKGLQKKQSF